MVVLSRFNCQWYIEEHSPYEYELLDMQAQAHKQPISINPMGRVPALTGIFCFGSLERFCCISPKSTAKYP